MLLQAARDSQRRSLTTIAKRQVARTHPCHHHLPLKSILTRRAVNRPMHHYIHLVPPYSLFGPRPQFPDRQQRCLHRHFFHLKTPLLFHPVKLSSVQQFKRTQPHHQAAIVGLLWSPFGYRMALAITYNKRYGTFTTQPSYKFYTPPWE